VSRRIITTGVQGFGPLPRMVRAQAGDAALEQLLAAFEIPLSLLDRPQARLPLADMVAIFDRAGEMLGDPLLGLAVGRGMQPEDYGVWVRYAVAGPTLAHGLARACRAVRYYQAAGSMRAELHGDLVRFAYHHLGVAEPLVRQHADHVLLPTINFARRFLGPDWLPLWVEVPYGAVGAAKDLADRIGVEVRYDRPGLGIVFDRALLDTPGRLPAPSVAELRRLVGGAAEEELTRALTDVVELRLSNGAVAIDGAARRLGLQPRTLQRRLQAEGRSYREIVDAARRARAEEALAATTTPVAEIATSLGYEEPAHFTRAFHRWHGCSPSAWRRARSTAVDGTPVAAA
jgi:AraC-like DNA-binding protein